MPAGDDIAKFLYNFSQSCHPIIVSVTAALLIGIGVVLMLRKGVMKNYILELKALRAEGLSTFS